MFMHQKGGLESLYLAMTTRGLFGTVFFFSQGLLIQPVDTWESGSRMTNTKAQFGFQTEETLFTKYSRLRIVHRDLKAS